MAMQGTIAGFPHPLLVNQFSFSINTIFNSAHANAFVVIDTTGGAVTVTFPLAATMAQGTFIWFSQQDQNNVQYRIQGSDTLNRQVASFSNSGSDGLGAIAIVENPTNWNLILHV